jgi:hypothetical protein
LKSLDTSFRIAESMGFASFANGSTCKGVYYIGEIDHDYTAWKSVDFRDRLQLPYGRSQLEAAGSTEESALSAAKRDLLSVLQNENKTSVCAESRLLDVAEVNNRTPLGAEEDRTVESLLKAPERASEENVTVGEMYERRISKCFQERNILNSHDPNLGVVCQEGKVVPPKSDRFAISEAGTHPACSRKSGGR